MNLKDYEGKNVPGILYHYCGNESLVKIVQSNSLFLSSVTGANDYEETQRVRPRIVEYTGKFLDGVKNAWMKRLLEVFDVNDVKPFVACFSENSDQLSQWRGYGDDGRGVAIGFNVSTFGVEKRLPFFHVTAVEAIGMHELIYDEEMQKTIADGIISQFINIVEADPNLLNAWAVETAIGLRKCSLVFKNPGFCEEAEWRIINTPILSALKNGPWQLIGAVGDRVTRVTNRGIVTSLALPLKQVDAAEPIVEVILGPRNTTHLFDLANLFHEHGLRNVNVTRSATSYI